MAAPTIRSSSQGYADASSVVVDKPAGTVEGDLIVAVLTSDTNGEGTTFFSPPAGWSTDDEVAAGSTYMGWHWVIAGPSEPATYTFTGGGTHLSVNLATIEGGTFDPGAPIDVSNIAIDESSPINIAAISTAGADRLALLEVFSLVGAGSVPSGFSTVQLNESEGWVFTLLASSELTAPGSHGPWSSTADFPRGGGVIAINPASPPVTGFAEMASTAGIGTGSGGTSAPGTISPDPAGVEPGDLLLAFTTHYADGATPNPIGWTDGWEQLFTSRTGTTRPWHSCFARIADGTSDDTFSAWGQTAVDICIDVVRITNHGVTDVTTDIPFTVTTSSGASSANADPPDLAPGSDKWLWLASMGMNSQIGVTVTAVPASYNTITLRQSANTNSSVSQGVGWRQLEASSENPGTFTSASQTWVAATLAIPPGGGGGATNITGTTAVIPMLAGEGVVTAQADLEGTTAVVQMLAGEGQIAATAAITGTGAQIAMLAGEGAVAGGTAITGTGAVIGMLAGEGPITASTAITGAGARISLLAGEGPITPQTDLEGTSARIAMLAGEGDVAPTTLITGTTAVIPMLAGEGNITAATAIVGTGASISLLAGEGTITAQADIEGQTAVIRMLAGEGDISGAIIIQGTGARIRMLAGEGQVTAQADLTGAGAVVAMLAGEGQVLSGVNIDGTTARIALLAGAGDIVGHAALEGTPAQIRMLAGIGPIDVPDVTHIVGTTARIPLLGGTGPITAAADIAGAMAVIRMLAGSGSILTTEWGIINGRFVTEARINGRRVVAARLNGRDVPIV